MSGDFPEAARVSLQDAQLRHNLRHATRTIRDKRAQAVAEVADWEQLREAGRRIKERALRHLDVHLEALEQRVVAAGGSPRRPTASSVTSWAPPARTR
jgi:L-lactate dehydrogenase complex protein LldF